jgi:hypothetical protein
MELNTGKEVRNLRMETFIKEITRMESSMEWVRLLLYRSVYLG